MEQNVSGRASENEGEGLPSEKDNTLENLTGTELHFDSDFEEPNDETESMLQDQSNIAPAEHYGDAPDEERISAKEDLIELNNILHALKTTVEYPDDIAKHNEVRTTLKTQTSTSSSRKIPPQILCSPSKNATTMSGT